ncbi:DUF4376 domain-containing protein, partial [Shigella sonnei]|uniref:DUF4376 domain-containing protein n=1 Tax=Shigella sonnei TaxID=624 RepID=UPI000A9BC03E
RHVPAYDVPQLLLFHDKIPNRIQILQTIQLFLYPVVMAAKSDIVRDVMTWGDADNQQVKQSMPELEELAAAMAQAQVERNDEIYRRQRELKEELNSLKDLNSVRNFIVE